MATAPFLRPIRALVDDIETIASGSACFKHQLCILSEIAAAALRDITAEAESEDANYDERFLSRIKVLEAILRDARDSAYQAATRHFLRVLWTREDPALAISAQFDATLEDLQALNLATNIGAGNIATRNDAARVADEAQRTNLLLAGTRDYPLLESLLQLDKCSPEVVVAAMQKQLEHTSDVIQQRFLRRAVDAIQTKKGVQVSAQPWLITSFEVDIGDRLGSGGFSDIHQGRWRGSTVAVKVLKAGRASVIDSELGIWERLRHPHVLQLFGASTLDSPPFLVMPLMRHGNLRDYLKTHRHAERDRLSHEIALGLEYLHAQGIVHGDLKAVNVLVDASESAVIADFGLSRSFASDGAGSTAGYCALRWMAPEQIKTKGAPTTAGDVYSYGMTLFELYTGLLPFQGMDDDTIAWLVVERRQRPTRNDDIHEAAWTLMSLCWTQSAGHRPTSSQVTSRTSNVLATQRRVRPARSGTSLGTHLSPGATSFGAPTTAGLSSHSGGSIPPSTLFSDHSSHSTSSSFSTPAMLASPSALKLNYATATPQLLAAPRGRGGLGAKRFAMPGLSEEVLASPKAIACNVTVDVDTECANTSSLSLPQHVGRGGNQARLDVRGHSPPPFANFSLDGVRRALPHSSSASSLPREMPVQMVGHPQQEEPVFFGRGGAGRGTKINLKGWGKSKKVAKA